MPKLPKAEACMLCDKLPCECNKTSKSTRVRPRQPGKTEGERAGLVGRADGALSPSTPDSGAQSKLAQSASDDLLVHVACIRTLAPILHPSEINRYSGVLSSPPSIEERSAIWRARREIA